jgi:hypothetical protein
MTTMTPDSDKCICSATAYASNCPQSFVQGGKLMHMVDGEPKVQLRSPRDYDSGSENSKSSDEIPVPLFSSRLHDLQREEDHKMVLAESGNQYRPRIPEDRRFREPEVAEYTTDEQLQKKRDITFSKFSALTVNGQEFGEYTIGGFGKDADLLKQKVTEYVPLPPVTLPVIFSDKPLNFSHHFFQGLEILLGRDFVNRMATTANYSGKDSQKLLPMIKQLILSGTQEDDTELTIFVKRVLSGTFNTLPRASNTGAEDCLIVGANLWGFQYIEGSMRLNDNEMRMWLNMNYSAYRISWFNAFKGSGVPSFCKEGVQDRYESRGDPEYFIRGESAQPQERSRRRRSPKNHDRASKSQTLTIAKQNDKRSFFGGPKK